MTGAGQALSYSRLIDQPIKWQTDVDERKGGRKLPR